MPWIRQPWQRKIYSMVLGACLGYFCYGFDYTLYVFQIMQAWLILRFFPRRFSPSIVMFTSGSLLLLKCAYMWCIDTTHFNSVKSAMMSSYIQICYVAINYADADPNLDAKGKSMLTSREKLHAECLIEVPSLIEWL